MRSNLLGTISRALLTLTLLWNLSTLAQQPTPILPDPKLTPGDVFDVTIQDICTPGYSKKVPAVTAKLQRQAYAAYGIMSWEPGDYEVDHLIPLSLGGSNSIRNLWPQSTTTSPWNSHVKDVLERRLHNLVCAGKVAVRRPNSRSTFSLKIAGSSADHPRGDRSRDCLSGRLPWSTWKNLELMLGDPNARPLFAI